MAAPVSVSKAFAQAVVRSLQALGYKRRSGGNVFTWETGADTLGWLGLNTASEHLKPRAIAVNPMIGVRFQQVERLVAELLESTYHPFTPPTLRCSLGYVTPARSYRSWTIEYSSLDSQIAGLVDEIKTYALPLYERHTQLDAFESLVEMGMIADDSRTPYRTCAAKVLLGRGADAADLAARAVRDFGDASNPAWDQFRRFASNLDSLVHSGRVG